METLPAGVDEAEMRRLLVVDDEEIVLVAIRETLSRAGYEVIATSDATEGLDALRRMRFAAIITDQQMPRMTGLEFLAQAKVLRPDAPRILITAVLNLGTVIEAINQGEIFRFVVKPWLREDFLGAVESAVVRYRRVAILGEQGEALKEETRRREEAERRLAEFGADAQERERETAELRREAQANRDRMRLLAYLVLSLRDPERGRRALHVVKICSAMAKSAEWPAEDRAALEDAAWFFDVGFLDPSVATAGKRLPRISAELVRALGLGEGVRRAVETHRERMDGSGFPMGLASESIPRLGRWLAVAVAYVEGNGGGNSSELLGEIRNGIGTRFDAEAVGFLEEGLRQGDPTR